MISHVVLHYNRPWLLETHVNLVRMFFPSITELIVADDGSFPEVIDHVKKLPIDKIYINKNHFCQWEKGSCSDTIRNAFSIASKKFLSFSEDDFFPCPNGIEDNSFYENGNFPDGKISCSSDVMREACDLLFKNKCTLVQVARDNCGWKNVPITGKKISTENLVWNQICHKKKKRFYYCNWPWIARRSDISDIVIPEKTSMWILESFLYKEFDKKFGLSNWSYCPDKRRFVHVGLPFSKKNLDFSDKTLKANIRNEQSLNFINLSVGNNEFKDIKHLNNFIMERWMLKKSCVSINDLMEIGIKEAFYKWINDLIK